MPARQRRERRLRHPQLQARQRLGVVHRVDALERQHRPALVDPRRRHGQRRVAAVALRVQHGARREPRRPGSRSSGFTITCPRWPCGRAMRPTSTMSSQAVTMRTGSPSPAVGIPDLERRLRAVMLRRRGDQRAQRLGGAPLAADHLAHVAGADRQLDDRHAAVRGLGDPHLRRDDRRAPAPRPRRPRRAGLATRYSAAGAAAAAGAGGRCRAISVRTVSDGRAPFDSQ